MTSSSSGWKYDLIRSRRSAPPGKLVTTPKKVFRTGERTDLDKATKRMKNRKLCNIWLTPTGPRKPATATKGSMPVTWITAPGIPVRCLPPSGAWSQLPLTLLALVAAAASAFSQNPLPDSFNPGANSNPYALAIQPDGKVLVAGWFTALGGQPCTGLARVNADGTLDASFNPNVAGGSVYAIAILEDGKILLGGDFTTIGGQTRNSLVRLNADGILDGQFRLDAAGGSLGEPGVFCFGIQSDGKILAGGSFTTLGGQPRANLARLNADGTLDNGFNPGADDYVNSVAVQADGKTLVGGAFQTLGGQPRICLGRINTDGTVDGGLDTSSWYPYTVSLVLEQADGKIVLASGYLPAHMERFDSDGTSGHTLAPRARFNAIATAVNAAVVQADGQILLGGDFYFGMPGPAYANLAQLQGDGTLNTNFTAGTGNSSSPVSCLALQADGKILAGGSFNTLGGLARTNLGRLNSTAPATQSLVYDGTNVTWLRGGSSPEVWRTRFDFSTNGSSWTPLGNGTRIPGGWRLTASSLPSTATVRARGWTTGGYGNGSTWFLESYWGTTHTARPRPTIDPASGHFEIQTGQFAFNVTASANDIVVIEASINLVNWLPVQTNTVPTNGIIPFHDPNSSTAPRRFYRVSFY
jgi:uncharacterized delta-60 repeat protein